MAESVDALVSNTSRFTPVPVRSRLWVLQNPCRTHSTRVFLFYHPKVGHFWSPLCFFLGGGASKSHFFWGSTNKNKRLSASFSLTAFILRPARRRLRDYASAVVEAPTSAARARALSIWLQTFSSPSKAQTPAFFKAL